jgi:hypothetical protein
MQPLDMIPGVPAAGHLSVNGFWHPGRADGCPKPPCADVQRVQQLRRSSATSPVDRRARAERRRAVRDLEDR